MLSVPPARGMAATEASAHLVAGLAKLTTTTLCKNGDGETGRCIPSAKDPLAASLSRQLAAFPVVFVKSALGNAAKVEAGRRHVLGQEGPGGRTQGLLW